MHSTAPTRVVVFCEKPAFSPVALPQTAAVGGLVRRPDGSPVVGATVRLWDDAWRLVAALETDSAGTFRFEGVRSGHYLASVDVPSGFALHSTSSSFGLEQGGRMELEFVLAPTGRVAGRVVARDPDQPLPGVEVAIIDAQGRPLATTRTGPAGDYVFTGIVADSVRVQILG